MSELDKLTTDESAIRALKQSASIMARRQRLDLPTVSRMTQALLVADAGEENLPPWLFQDSPNDARELGPIARKALDAMLSSPLSEGLHAAAIEAIDAQGRVQGQSLESVIAMGGVVVVALGFLSKWSYSREKGHCFATGLPDLDRVLAKLAPVFKGIGQG